MRTLAPLLLFACVSAACGSSPSTPLDAGMDAAPRDAGSDAGAFAALDPALCPAASAEALRGFDPSYTLAHGDSIQQDKSFYLVTLFETLPAARSSIIADTALSALASRRARAVSDARDTCAGEPTCLGAAAKWSDAEIMEAGMALAASTDLAPLAADLRRSGTAILHANGSDAELLHAAWTDVALALNRGWERYYVGLPAADRARLLADAVDLPADAPFFAPLLQLVLGSLEANARDEATRYEPLADGENRAALAHMPGVDFASYPFSLILVPGLGPMDLDDALSPGGQVRADQAAARFDAGLAPLIVLSGGHVHPDRTPYAEALEMKRYLMDAYAIPEEAILVEPHARHTTTNLRNVARLLYRSGVPVNRPALITTDLFQTIYISLTGDMELLGQRSLEDLGYKPWRDVTPLDTLDDCWLPSVQSLQQDPRDLLDP